MPVKLYKPSRSSKIKKLLFSCLRCRNEWFSRKEIKSEVDSLEEINIEDYKPISCPKCHSPYWDKPRKNKLKGKRFK